MATVPPGRNATLRHAWNTLYGKPQKTESVRKEEAAKTIAGKRAVQKDAKKGGRK